MQYRLCLMIFTGLTFIIGCSGPEKKAGVANIKPSVPKVMEPFRYHKLVEVSPGQDYDVMSWGRGSKLRGAFQILHSDSASAKFTTTTGDLDGTIVDVYNSDMDLDGNPEIIIQAKGKDTINHITIYAFEFNNSKANKLDFPKLTKAQRKGYRGDDNFYIKEGILMREFPIYDGNGSGAKSTGAKMQLQYGLRNNEFTVKELSTKSADALTDDKEKQPPKKEVKEEKKSLKKSRKQALEKKSEKKKKHRRHHSSNDE